MVACSGSMILKLSSVLSDLNLLKALKNLSFKKYKSLTKRLKKAYEAHFEIKLRQQF